MIFDLFCVAKLFIFLLLIFMLNLEKFYKILLTNSVYFIVILYGVLDRILYNIIYYINYIQRLRL